MTTLNGTVAYCAFGAPVSIQFTCTGTQCDELSDFPDVDCVIAAGGLSLTCSNGFVCEKALWSTDMVYTVSNDTSPTITEKHVGTIPECDYKYELTSNGRPSGSVFRSLTALKPECDRLIEIQGYDSPRNGGMTSVGSVSPRPTPTVMPISGGPRARPPRLRPMLILVALLGFFMPAFAGLVDTLFPPKVVPAKPDDAIFAVSPGTATGYDACARYRHLLSQNKARDTEDKVARLAAATHLDERQLSGFISIVRDKLQGELAGYVSGKVSKYAHGDKGFKDCWQAEMGSTLCSIAVKHGRNNLIPILGELTPACVNLVNMLGWLPSPPPVHFLLSSKFAASVACGFVINEMIPLLPCLTQTICSKDYLEAAFPSTKCEGPLPLSDPVGTQYTWRTSVDYQSGGSMLNNPNKCGGFNSQCESARCENAACTKTACVGKTCDTFKPCGPGGGCVCGTIADSASGFCVYGPTPCDTLETCSSSAQCRAGEVCIESSCCQRSVCAGAGQCGGSSVRRRWPAAPDDGDAGVSVENLLARGWVNATLASQGVWVD